MEFEDLRLSAPLLRAVRQAGYGHPTPVQSTTIPHVLDGRDVVANAQTGTGKTAAFALPILQRLSINESRTTSRSRPVRALVLCPTRELAQQILESFRGYGAHTGLSMSAIVGGVNQGSQVRLLRQGVDILIATPGRLLDIINQKLLRLEEVEVLVLDEADRMLDMGFLPDIRRILARIPRERQTLLFSATMPASIRELARQILRDPVEVQVSRVSSPAPMVDQWVHHVEKPAKTALLLKLLGQSPRTRTLVFTRTKHGADKVVRSLVQVGVPAVALHGNKSQGARTRALAEFKSSPKAVLVATDIAARGLDVNDISHVINYDLTADAETYVHRIGRTGRAGAKGIAISFCTAEESADLRSIERLIQQPLLRAEPISGQSDRQGPRPATGENVPYRKSSSSDFRNRRQKPARFANSGSQSYNHPR